VSGRVKLGWAGGKSEKIIKDLKKEIILKTPN
jgi:hypothetical protein